MWQPLATPTAAMPPLSHFKQESGRHNKNITKQQFKMIGSSLN